ncbi:hypothetical protein ACT3TZ_13810 [Brachybacterium sp. AOP25-B2-12]|uniref:hypothetical protein n=1 Tax=Brachybacterium sp. AOP25-B2-12 TaxID=3457710 RepID=UPI0040334D36
MTDVLPRLPRVFFPRHLPNLLIAIRARPRLVMWIQAALIAYAVMVAAAPPALAAPPNPLAALDRTDSYGFAISNYNIEYLIDLLSTEAAGQGMTAWFVKILWDGYRYGVGAAALIIDLALGFGWLDYLSYPVEQTAEVLDKLLDQLPGVRELLITLAIGWGLFRFWMGQAARGLMDMLGSMTAWGVSAAVVTNPVAWITGPNGILTRTKDAGQQFSAQLVNPTAGAGAVDSSQSAGTLAEQIATIFVRKPHQFVAYGGLADGGGCEQTYNENLTKSGKDLANAMLSCSPDFGETIKNPSTVTLLTAIIVLVGALVLIGVAVLCSAIILYEVVNILIAALQLVWELFRAIGPGGSYLGLMGQAFNIAESILAMLFVIMVNALYLGVVMYVFTKWDDEMITMFLIVDVILVVIIAVILKQRAKLRKHFERMKERSRAKGNNTPAPQRLIPRGMGRGGFAAGAATAAGSKVASTAGRAGQRMARGAAGAGLAAGKKTASVATAPARAASRAVSRPGFLAARLSSGLLHKAGVRHPAAHAATRKTAHAMGERRWTKKEAARERKREQRAEKRAQAQFWTWGGAKRDATARAAEQAALRPGAKPERRGLRRPHAPQRPGATAPEPRTSRRRAPATPPTPPTGKSGPAPKGRSRTGNHPEPAAQPRVTVPGREKSAASAKERLHKKMRTQSGQGRPSRTLRNRRRPA